MSIKHIPLKDRASMVFVYYGRIDVKDRYFVVINEVDEEDRERKHIRGDRVTCIMSEPDMPTCPAKAFGCGLMLVRRV